MQRRTRNHEAHATGKLCFLRIIWALISIDKPVRVLSKLLHCSPTGESFSEDRSVTLHTTREKNLASQSLHQTI
eukprot:1027527-Pleurochrysis_carterae.AAC.1